MYTAQNCGSWLACESGPATNQSPQDVHRSKLWELACLRRRPSNQPISPGCTPLKTVGAGLSAKAAQQPTNLPPDVHHSKLWELACLRKRPSNQPISPRMYTAQNCGSEQAREGSLVIGKSCADHLDPQE